MFNFIQKNPKIFLGLHIFKTIFSIACTILAIILLFTVFHPFQIFSSINTTKEEIAVQREQTEAIHAYVSGESDDTANVPEYIVERVEAQEASEAKIADVQQALIEWLDDSDN